MKQNGKYIGIRIPEDMALWLQKLADRDFDEQVSMAVRSLIRDAMRQQDRPQPE